jgi:acetylornithine deacetylase/succinyl-diaminopimelate desuccinylase-like protein
MLNGHTDTVRLNAWMNLCARIEGNRMYGRARMMKSGVAASLMAAKRAKSLHLSGDVMVSCAARGSQLRPERHLPELPRWRPDAVIVTEPTEMGLLWPTKALSGSTSRLLGSRAWLVRTGRGCHCQNGPGVG